MPRETNGFPRIYSVNVYAKGAEDKPPVLKWEGRAFNIMDAFHQARQAYAPMMHNSAMLTLLTGIRDA